MWASHIYAGPIFVGCKNLWTRYIGVDSISVRGQEYTLKQGSSMLGTSGARETPFLPNLPPIVSFGILNQKEVLNFHLWVNDLQLSKEQKF